jgi:predicted RNase H-like HicB family nuclease
LKPERWVSVLPSTLPPVVTYGATYEAAMYNAREAIELILAVYRDEGIAIPNDSDTRVEKLTVAA